MVAACGADEAPTKSGASTPGEQPAPPTQGAVVRNGKLGGRLIVEPRHVMAGGNIGIAVENVGTVPIYYGPEAQAQRRVAGGWVNANKAVFGQDRQLAAVLWSVPTGQTAGPNHVGLADRIELPRGLEAGTYRLIRKVSGDQRSLGQPHVRLRASFRVH
jgi:hypothetical protein